MILRLISAVILSTSLSAQTANTVDPCPTSLQVLPRLASATNDKFTPPKTVRVVEPSFTPEARRARFTAGTVILGIVIPPDGKACDIRILSPLGLGLDEEAIQTVQKWRFSPATLEGKPVAFAATIEVNFKFFGYDLSGDEKNRSQFNRAISNLRSKDPGESAFALASLKTLSNKKYPPADGLLALYHLRGEFVPLDADQGVMLAKRAIGKYDRIGFYALGYAYENGLGVPKDEGKAFEQYIEAAKSGHSPSQLRIARAYASGKNLPVDFTRAEKFYRLCAVQSLGPCAYELASLLQARKAAKPAEIAAWALLARDLGVPEAKAMVDSLAPESLREGQDLKASITKIKR